jgi:hypothetical protein
LVLPNPDNPEANREKALAMFDMRPDGKQLPRPAIAHMKLGEPLDESTRKMFRQNLTRMSREAVDPASDFDRWHMRIMVVLLTAALEGRDVNTLTEATGYPRSFIEHVWQRAEQTGVDLNPLNWIADDGCTSVALWQDASVIEGRVELERYSDGTVALVDVPNSDEFVPHDFIAALRAGHKLRVCSRRGHLRSK